MSNLLDSNTKLLRELPDRLPDTVTDTVADMSDAVDLDQIADSLVDAADALSEVAVVAGRRTTRLVRSVGRSTGRAAGATARVARSNPKKTAFLGIAAIAAVAVVVSARRRTDADAHPDLQLADAA